MLIGSSKRPQRKKNFFFSLFLFLQEWEFRVFLMSIISIPGENPKKRHWIWTCSVGWSGSVLTTRLFSTRKLSSLASICGHLGNGQWRCVVPSIIDIYLYTHINRIGKMRKGRKRKKWNFFSPFCYYPIILPFLWRRYQRSPCAHITFLTTFHISRRRRF